MHNVKPGWGALFAARHYRAHARAGKRPKCQLGHELHPTSSNQEIILRTDVGSLNDDAHVPSQPARAKPGLMMSRMGAYSALYADDRSASPYALLGPG